MENVKAVLDEVSAVDLKRAVLELKQLRDEGVLPFGVVRTVAAMLQSRTSLSEGDARKVAESELLATAAFLWAGTSR